MKPNSDHTDNAPGPLPATANMVEWLRRQLRDFDRESEQRAAQRRMMAEMLATAEAEAAGDVDGDDSTDGPGHTPVHRGGVIAIPEDADITDLEVDLENAANTLQRIIRIAEAVQGTGKLLNVTQIARFIIGAGQSRATVQNMRVSVQRNLDRNPGLFEKVRPATYRYLGGAAVEDP